MIKLSDKRKLEMKKETVQAMKKLTDKMTPKLEVLMMQDGAVSPRAKPKGYFLLEPEDLVSESHYLVSGYAKLFSVDPKTRQEKIFFAWTPGMFIVMYKEFRANLPIGDYYIRLMEDAELVTITNTCLEGVYENHPAAHEITEQILTDKKRKMFLQMDILLTQDKTERRNLFKRHFPQLAAVMSRREICSFIGIGRSTFGDSAAKH